MKLVNAWFYFTLSNVAVSLRLVQTACVIFFVDLCKSDTMILIGSGVQTTVELPPEFLSCFGRSKVEWDVLKNISVVIVYFVIPCKVIQRQVPAPIRKFQRFV